LKKAQFSPIYFGWFHPDVSPLSPPLFKDWNLRRFRHCAIPLPSETRGRGERTYVPFHPRTAAWCSSKNVRKILKK